MTNERTILVTGIATFWGSSVATQLLTHNKYHVIGLDKEPPKELIKGLDFIQADIRNSLLPELFKSEEIDTLVHLGLSEINNAGDAAFDTNVLGTMKLFRAAEQAGVRKIILRSSTTVYGAYPDNSAFLTEDHPLRGTTNPGYIRDLMEIEAFCNGFRVQAQQIILTVLRFPNIIGSMIDSPMTRFLQPNVVPVLMGFAPQFQFLHQNDAIDALCHTVENDMAGVFNIAAEGILPLDKILAITGRIPLPIFHLFIYGGRTLLGNTGITKLMPFEPDYMRYSWVADIQKMRDEFGFTPKYSSDEALREFAGHLRMRNYLYETSQLAYDQERLRDTIERRNRVRRQNQSTRNQYNKQSVEED